MGQTQSSDTETAHRHDERIAVEEAKAELRESFDTAFARIRNLGVRLWHDDIRPPPAGWQWARTNKAAEEILVLDQVIEISLDHDLGFDYFSEDEINANPRLLFARGQGDQTGYDLVHWMIENDRVPETVTIHSWNHDGARRMAALLARCGHASILAPYSAEAELLPSGWLWQRLSSRMSRMRQPGSGTTRRWWAAQFG